MPKRTLTEKKSLWKTIFFLLYPYLLAFYPILALRNHNVDYVDFASILRSLILIALGTLFIQLITLLLMRNLEKSSLIVSLVMLLFLSYGHLYNQLETLFGFPIHHRYLAGAEILLVLLAILFVYKSKQFATVLSQFMGVASLVLIGMVLLDSLRNDFRVYRAEAAVTSQGSSHSDAQTNAALPDFYLIILDGHTRSDVLKTRFEYDNSGFIQQLRDLGFYVADCGQSNYASTKLSLVSSMFGDYVQNFVPEGQALPPLKASAVNQTLRALGYKTIAFQNRAQGQFDLKEDITLSRHQMALGKFDLNGGINEFEKMLIDTSFMHFLVDTELIPGLDRDTILEWEDLEHYYQTNYILSELEKLPAFPSPKFVYAHLMIPHSPFIFAPDGSFLRNNSPIDGYRSNVEFIDTRLPSVLRTIIQNSSVDPIIIVMGDHGPSTRKTITEEMRMSILNAYHVNDTAKALLYPGVTPVNATRIILNAHYGAEYPLLDDISYYAYKPSELPDAERIPNECQISP